MEINRLLTGAVERRGAKTGSSPWNSWQADRGAECLPAKRAETMVDAFDKIQLLATIERL